VPELLRQLQHGGQEEQLQAALALEQLAQTEGQPGFALAHKAIVQAGGLRTLVAALGSSSMEVQGAVAGEPRALLGSGLTSSPLPSSRALPPSGVSAVLNR
jgi:hypothetical protein